MTKEEAEIKWKALDEASKAAGLAITKGISELNDMVSDLRKLTNSLSCRPVSFQEPLLEASQLAPASLKAIRNASRKLVLFFPYTRSNLTYQTLYSLYLRSRLLILALREWLSRAVQVFHRGSCDSSSVPKPNAQAKRPEGSA